MARLLAEHSGLGADDDFFSIHSPQRVYSRRVFSDLDAYPKLIGVSAGTGELRGAGLYRLFLDVEVREMCSAEAAELPELAETIYRDVNIALANESARFADRVGVDVHKVIDASTTRSHFRTVIDLGRGWGDCIPSIRGSIWMVTRRRGCPRPPEGSTRDVRLRRLAAVP